jgi:hypothetical protein
VTRFRHNYRGFWKDYGWFVAVFVLAVFCDAGSTIFVMLQQGPEVEIHIVVRFISGVFGPVAGPLLGAVGKVAAGVIVAVYLRRFAAYIFVAASLLAFWATWYNVWGHNVYTPFIFKWLCW